MRRGNASAGVHKSANAEENAQLSPLDNGKTREVDSMKCIAQFATALSEAFRTCLGDDSAKTFCQLLKQTLLSEYRAWWLSVRGLVHSILICVSYI